MKIIFIRHADPDYENNTLTPKGFLEARALGEAYSADNFDCVYTSPLPRARLTCDAVIKGKKEVNEEPWLSEFHHPLTIDGEKVCNWDLLPSFVEKHKEELFNEDTYLDSKIMKTGSVKEAADDVLKQFDLVLEQHGYKREGLNYHAINPNNSTIAIFAHLGINSLLISHLIHVPYWQFAQYFCMLTSSVTTFVSEEREDGTAQFRCIGFSDVNHLKKANLEPSFAARFRETRFSKDRK